MKLKSSICSCYKEPFEIFTLENDKGMEVEIISLGAAITKIMTPDRNGVIENVVLGYESLKSYYENPSSFGAVVGRTAGRIGNAEFKINGEEYHTPDNDNGNTLHGGYNGIKKKNWKGELVEEGDSVGVRLTCESADGEEGYPGNIKAAVYYKLDNENRLSMIYSASTDKPTLFNPTNHSYFNLSGDCKRDVLKQKVMINADSFCEIDDRTIATGRLINVEGTPFDFRCEKEIGRDINEDYIQLKYGNGYDHPWILNKDGKTSATFRDEASGRYMEMTTTAEAVVCYTMNYFSGEALSCGKKTSKRMACCFETQSPPIGYNDEFIEGSIVTPENGYEMTTVFKFSAE